jgi:peptide/nickel transport system permease protein
VARLPRRLLHLVAVLITVTFITFTLLNLLPGDVTFAILGNDVTPESVAAVRQELGLDRPLLLRYLGWLGQVAQGDFGHSFITGERVAAAIERTVPVSLELMLVSLLLSLALALPAGLFAAYRAGGTADRILTAVASLLLSAPVFMLALLLMFFFALRLRWLPTVGFVPLSDGIAGNLRSLALPATTLALVEWPVFMRILRSDAITTLKQDFILMAKAKGLRDYAILLRHVLKPSSFTLITVIGLTVGGLIAGALVTESIFALPGIGRLLVASIANRDFMMVQGAVTVVAVGFVLVNFAVDLLYAALDPRVTR